MPDDLTRRTLTSAGFRGMPGGSVELSFSSDRPVDMGTGLEVLEHKPGSVDLSRLTDGAPLLLDHDRTRQIGVVQSAWLDGGKGRARVRFSKSPLGQEILQDVKDGIRKSVSVGYRVIRDTFKGDIRHVTSWLPMELSIVSMPADTSVGVGRSAPKSKLQPVNFLKKTDGTPNPKPTNSNQKGNRMTIKEMTEARALAWEKIDALDNQGELTDMEQEYRSTLEAEAERLTKDINRQNRLLREEGNAVHIRNRDHCKGQYSLLKALRQHANGHLDGIEAETASELEKVQGRAASGIYVPLAAFSTRDLSVTGGTSTQHGGAMVGTDTSGFIDALRNRLVLGQLGATTLSGLSGNISVPRQVAASAATWKSETAELDEASPAFASMDLSPKRVGAFTVVSKQLLVQTDSTVERLIRDDLLSAVATALDAAAINGSGSGAVPEGILRTTGIGAVIGGTNGAAPDWKDLTDLLAALAVDNVPDGSLGWVTNPLVRAKLQQTLAVSEGDSTSLWDKAIRDLPGQWAITNQVPSTLDKGSSTGVCSAIVCGDFRNLVMGIFGQAADVVVDHYTLATSGQTRIIVNFFCDVGIRRAEGFAAMQDALTA